MGGSWGTQPKILLISTHEPPSRVSGLGSAQVGGPDLYQLFVYRVCGSIVRRLGASWWQLTRRRTGEHMRIVAWGFRV